MEDGTVLTIAMSETKKNNYHIVGYLKEHGDFVSFNTDKYFFDNKPLLDIGAYSKVKFIDKGSNEIELGNDITLVESLEKYKLIEFLEEKKSSFARFKRVINTKFAIVEVKYIEEIKVICKDNGINTYLVAIINGQKAEIKVKDFRWVNYWTKIFDKFNKSELEEKIAHYKDFFNTKKTYLLLYRYKNETSDNGRYRQINDVYWISGIFYA